VRIAILVLALASCYRAELRERAATDFQCPRDQIATRQLDEETVHAQGCGHSANYQWDGKAWVSASAPAASK
jgi:hypothetical protein